MSKLLSVLIVLAGLAAGLGAGHVLRPQPDLPDLPDDTEVSESLSPPAASTRPRESSDVETVAMREQFVVPIITAGAVRAMMVISLAVEVAPGETARVASRESRLRDAFLQVMFDHANSGGFDGVFTANTAMQGLRMALREAAQNIIGESARDVLITEFFRRDV